jgi:peptidoglycan-associated lipoprotein
MDDKHPRSLRRRRSFGVAVALAAATMIGGLGCSGAKPQQRADASKTAPAAPAPQKTASAAPEPRAAAASAPCPKEVGPIRFAFNSTQLTDEAQRALAELAACIVNGPTAATHGLIIEGHCDERGTTEYNLALGARRADAVRDYLSRLGVNRGQIKTVSFGKERPLDPRSNEDAWSKNRRAQVVES